jgi:hypothetical protein
MVQGMIAKAKRLHDYYLHMKEELNNDFCNYRRCSLRID